MPKRKIKPPKQARAESRLRAKKMVRQRFTAKNIRAWIRAIEARLEKAGYDISKLEEMGEEFGAESDEEFFKMLKTLPYKNLETIMEINRLFDRIIVKFSLDEVRLSPKYDSEKRMKIHKAVEKAHENMILSYSDEDRVRLAKSLRKEIIGILGDGKGELFWKIHIRNSKVFNKISW